MDAVFSPADNSYKALRDCTSPLNTSTALIYHLYEVLMSNTDTQVGGDQFHAYLSRSSRILAVSLRGIEMLLSGLAYLPYTDLKDK